MILTEQIEEELKAPRLTLLLRCLLQLSLVEPLQRPRPLDDEAVGFGVTLKLVAIHLEAIMMMQRERQGEEEEESFLCYALLIGACLAFYPF